MKKILVSVSCTILLIVLIGVGKLFFVAPHVLSSKFDYDRFWLIKTHCSSEYDIVLIGDSRIKNGLSPLHMETILENHEILNFGYNQLLLKEYIINAATSKFRTGSRQRIIVIGVAAGGFSEGKRDGNGLHKEYIEKGRNNYLALKFFGPSLKMIKFVTDPISFNDFSRREGLEGRLIKKYWDNGWMSVRADDIKEEEVEKMVQKGILEKQGTQKISQNSVDNVNKEIKNLVAEGIKVFLIRMPTNSSYEKFENLYYGFDESKVRQGMENSGGVWLNVDKAPYSTFDGVHLKQSSAEKLSITIARMIKENLENTQSNTNNKKDLSLIE